MAFTALNCVAGEVLTATKMNLFAGNDNYLKDESERIDGEQQATAEEVTTIKADIEEAAGILDSILGENTGTDNNESENGGGSSGGNDTPTTPPTNDTENTPTDNSTNDEEVANG